MQMIYLSDPKYTLVSESKVGGEKTTEKIWVQNNLQKP